MFWIPWPKTDCGGIARYVDSELVTDDLLPPGTTRRRLRLSRKYDELVRLIYDRLCELNIQYSDSLPHFNQESQRIRSPQQIVLEYKQGTCLDLAALFCSVCLSCKLLPALIITELHAFAAVSLEYEYQDRKRHATQPYMHNGFVDLAQLRALVEREGYLVIECTGFACGAEDAGYTELRAANNGFLPFEDACAAGRERLMYADSIQCIADIGTLHELQFRPLARDLVELPSRFAEEVYGRAPRERVDQGNIEKSFAAFEEALAASLSTAVHELSASNEFNIETIESVAEFVQQPEVQQSFAELLFDPEKNQKPDLVGLHKKLESAGMTITSADFDKIMTGLLEGFDRASLQLNVLSSARSTQLLKQIAEDIRSGRIEVERQRRYEALESTIRKKAQQWLERNPHAQDLLKAAWGQLLLSVYPFLIAGFTAEPNDLEMFCEWLQWRGLDQLSQHTREIMLSISGRRIEDITANSLWFTKATAGWSIEIDKLLDLVNFIWLRLISQALASIDPAGHLDLLFEIRLYAETQRNPRLVFRTSNIVSIMLNERNLDIGKLQQRQGDLEAILQPFNNFQQQVQRIQALLYEDPEPRLRRLGFYSAEDLFAFREKNLQACWPLPSQLEKRSGFTHWPLACDIEHGHAIRTEAFLSLQQYADQGNIVLLFGKWGNGKTTCARLYAYEWLKNHGQRGTVLYFGNIGSRSETSLIEAYAKFPVREVIELIRKTTDPLIILDDVQYGFEVVEDFVRVFQNEFNDKSLILISTTFMDSMSDAGERLLKRSHDILRIQVRLELRDVQRLVQAYWPPHIPRRENIPRREEAEIIQRRAERDWSLLHIYVSRFDEQQFELLANHKNPHFGKNGLKREFFDARFLRLPMEMQNTAWEFCALGSIQLPVLEDVLRQDRARYVRVQQLLSDGFLVRQTLPNVGQRVAYTLHLPRLASYYLRSAEENGLILQIDALPDEVPVAAPYPTIPVHRFIVRAMARYLLARPGNYSHVFLLAFTNRREDLLQMLLDRGEPWHKTLLNQLIEACNTDNSPVQVALMLNLLSRVNRSLPRDLLEQKAPHFNESRLITQLLKRVRSQETSDILEGMLALRYLRHADRDWSRNRIVTAVVPQDTLIDILIQSPLQLASQLFAEVYRLKPSYARSVFERLPLEDQRQGIRQRVISALEQPTGPNNQPTQHSPITDARLIEITSFLDSLAMGDHTWTNRLLAEIGHQPFTRRILQGVEPAILGVSVGQLFRVSPGFVYDLYDQWQRTPDVMLTLAASFASHTQRFSKALRSLRDLAETVPKLSKRIFDLIPISEWKTKWQETPYVSEFNSGFRNLLTFYPDGASRLLAAFSTDELYDAVHSSLTPGLMPYFLSGLILTLADLHPSMLGEFLEKFEIGKIITIFRSEGARLPSVALLIAALTHINASDEQALMVWNQFKDYIEKELFGEAAPIDVARFYTYLKNHLSRTGHAQLSSEIANTANVLIEQGALKVIVEGAGDLAQTGQILNSIGYWSEHERIYQFIYEHGQLLNNRVKRSRDVTDIGSFLRVIGKFAPDVHTRLIKNLDWDFIIHDFKNEFKLGRIVVLLEGILAAEDVSEDVVGFAELTEATLATSQLHVAQQQLLALTEEFVAQIDDEPNLSTINNLLYALWRISPDITQVIIETFDREKLLSRLFAEPRISVVCKMLSVLSRIDRSLAIWLTGKLGENADSMSIKLFLEPRLDLFALDLYRLHGGEWARLVENWTSTAEKMLSSKSFDQEELLRRVQREHNNLNVAALLYNLSIIDKQQAQSILRGIHDTTRWLRQRTITDQPETVALLFALRLVSQHYARTFAEHLLSQRFLLSVIEKASDVRLIAWAAREFGITLTGDQAGARLAHEIPWPEISAKLISAWHDKHSISIWELGWCLWALAATDELRVASAAVRRDLIQHHGSLILDQIERVQQPIQRAFGLLGFGVELALLYRGDWRDLALDLKARLPEAPGNVLIYNDEKDNSLQQIARSIGLNLEGEEPEFSMEDAELLESFIWSYCWRWFHFGDFSSSSAEL